MKKSLLSILKIGLPLGLGIFLVWYVFSKLTPSDIEDIKNAFANTNYFWIGVSIVLAILSHVSRAYRWKYSLEPLGIKPKFWNSFFAVMIGYLINLAIPRLGEVSRCAVMAKYEKQPFNKLFGTVIAERVADSLILLSFIFAVVFIQFDVLYNFLDNHGVIDKFTGVKLYVVLFVLGVLAFVSFKLLKNSTNPFFIKIRTAVYGVLEGVAAILKMKHRWKFIFHTLFIWFMYVMMFYVAFLALPDTRNVPIDGVVTAFVIGGISIAVTNGGIGAYPLGIQQILLLYNVDANTGLAFGWIVWTAQTVMIIVLGALSFILMPVYNKDVKSN